MGLKTTKRGEVVAFSVQIPFGEGSRRSRRSSRVVEEAKLFRRGQGQGGSLK